MPACRLWAMSNSSQLIRGGTALRRGLLCLSNSSTKRALEATP